MFDPTIYENLKVVIEGEIYEHDLSGEIRITDRQDQINLATMSRFYSVSFMTLGGDGLFEATIRLEADSSDLYGEILERSDLLPGCHLTLTLFGSIKEIDHSPVKIQNLLEKIWGNRPKIEQQIQFIWDKNNNRNYFTNITLMFDRKINEDHIEDFTEIIALLCKSLNTLEQIK